jgi:hypothetical protein
MLAPGETEQPRRQRYVSWSALHHLWRARVSVLIGRTVLRKSLGLFCCKEAAARAVRRFFGEAD